MFRTVPLSIIRSFSLYTQQWYMSYSLRAGSGRSVLILLASCQYLGRGISGAATQSVCVLNHHLVTHSVRENTQKYEDSLKNMVTDFKILTLPAFPFTICHYQAGRTVCF